MATSLSGGGEGKPSTLIHMPILHDLSLNATSVAGTEVHKRNGFAEYIPLKIGSVNQIIETSFKRNVPGLAKSLSGGGEGKPSTLIHDITLNATIKEAHK